MPQHYGFPYNKNFIFRGDDWLLATRMEQLVQNRNEVGLVEVITWNDYGESHYVGPIHGDQPGSEEWVNGFDHQGMCAYSYHAHDQANLA